MRRLVAHATGRARHVHPTPFASLLRHGGTGRVIGRRVNGVRALTDPTAHAEVRTLRAGCRRLKSISLRGWTLYTTCEPCPMCMAAALWAGVDRVVFGATIDDAARYCGQIYIYAKDLVQRSDLKCEVAGPVEQAACVGLFELPSIRRAMAARHRPAKA
jgi:tRNA(Arg) A34 adenosine deaminase TadA